MGAFIGPMVMLLMFVILPAFLIFWNKRRIKGKMLCLFLQGDIYMKPMLCEYRDEFVFYQSKAYDIYPQRVRLTRFPAGWPSILQEIVPTALYDVANGIPLNWNDLPDQRDARLRAMNIKSALAENAIRKLVQEAATEGGPIGGFRFNWRKVLPIMLIVGAVIGLIFIMRGGGGIFGLFGG